MSGTTRETGVDDYVGEVGHERHAVHQTHFSPIGVKLRGDHPTGYKWIETRPGKWVRIPALDTPKKD